MKFLRRLIRRWIGVDRYHDQAAEVNNRGLRMEILNKRLQVIERRGTPR
ncbi:MAG TPA: hypothetical protein VK845_04850 [Gemmatimonadales bacterium]|nr:hypothetical protein [Gemmatimonadales bacterium]